MKKYLADTNVLLNNPEVLEDYNVVIPSHVLREIEHLELTRKQDRTLQWQIRRFKKILDANEHFHVDLKDYEFTLRDDWDGKYVDNILVQIVVDEGYGMISNDRLLKDKCRLYGVEVVELDKSNYVDHKGFKEVYMVEMEYNQIYQNLHVNTYDLLTNEYLIVRNDVDGEVMDVFKWNGEMLQSLQNKKGKINFDFKTSQFDKFSPKDVYQIIAMDSIFSNQLTSIRGRAGSGKSLIALNVAWKLVEQEDYRLVIFVNPTPLRDSQELGFYKGDRLEKLMQSAVGTMLSSKFGDLYGVEQQIARGNLEILPFVDLRGYDSGEKKTIVWILEAQNLTADLMKLGLQRISTNTKVIVDGDYFAQVDKDSYASNNGMKRMSEVFRGSELYGEVELQAIYRSALADLADKM